MEDLVEQQNKSSEELLENKENLKTLSNLQSDVEVLQKKKTEREEEVAALRKNQESLFEDIKVMNQRKLEDKVCESIKIMFLFA